MYKIVTNNKPFVTVIAQVAYIRWDGSVWGKLSRQFEQKKIVVYYFLERSSL